MLVIIAMTLGLVVPSAGYRAVASLRAHARHRAAHDGQDAPPAR